MTEQGLSAGRLPSVRGNGGIVRRRVQHRYAQRRSPSARTTMALVPAGLAFLGTAGAAPNGAVSPVGAPLSKPPARFVPGPCPKTPEPVPGRCGVLEVPENRAHRRGRTIRLAVAIIPAASAQPAGDPVVFMTGVPEATRWGTFPS